MKNLLNFIDENFGALFMTICLFAFIFLIIICEYELAKIDLFDLEKSCYEYYKENNYILEECTKYSNKFKKEE